MTTPLAERVLAGDARSIARAISLVEDEAPAGADLIRDIYPGPGARISSASPDRPAPARARSSIG